MRKITRTNVELSTDIRAMLDQLAESEQRTLKGELEFLIQRRYREICGERVVDPLTDGRPVTEGVE